MGRRRTYRCCLGCRTRKWREGDYPGWPEWLPHLSLQVLRIIKAIRLDALSKHSVR